MIEECKILRCKKSSWIVTCPYNIEIDSCPHQYSKTDNDPSYHTLCFGHQPTYAWHNQHQLKIACGIPSPIVTTFICNRIVWEVIDGECEDWPPVLTTVIKPTLIREPTRPIRHVRSNLPSKQENYVCNRGQPQKSQSEKFQIILKARFIHFLDFDVGDASWQKKEFVEAYVCRVDGGK